HGCRGAGQREREERERGGEWVEEPASHTAGPRRGHLVRLGTRDEAPPVSSLWSSATSSSGSSGIGLFSSCCVRVHAAMVTPVYSLPSSKIAVVTASEQRQLFHRQALRPWQFVVSR